MEGLSIEQARSLLMEEDIAPMSAAAEADESASADEPVEAAGSEGEAAEAAAVESETAEEAAEGERSFSEGAVGLGVDIVEIERMRQILARRPRFAEQVFSPEERHYCDKSASPATHYAMRFAAKEAVVKALGTGFAEGIWVNDIEVERAKNGRPSAKLSGRALEVAESQGVRELSLSMSYTHTDAVACAMAVTEAAIRETEKRKDPMEELAKQFKETRKMLDEL